MINPELPSEEAVAETIQQLSAYGPIKILTGEPGYTDARGFAPIPSDPDKRQRFWLGHESLNITISEGTPKVEVTTPGGPKDLPLGQIKRVRVDHPLGSYMPLKGQHMFKLVLARCGEIQNVPSWNHHEWERPDGSHLHDVLDREADSFWRGIGIVRTYDISSPHSINTTLEEAKEMRRPYGLFLISALGGVGTNGLTVITSRMGYQETRIANVLPPESPPMPARQVNMLDVGEEELSNLWGLHVGRIHDLANLHGSPVDITPFQVDDAFLYMAHD